MSPRTPADELLVDATPAGIDARVGGTTRALLDAEATLEDWARTRRRSRSALASMDHVTSAAETWFTEEGIDHMLDHTVQLRLWAERRKDTR